MFREDKPLPRFDKKQASLNLFVRVYEIAQNRKRTPTDVMWLKNAAFNHDLEINGSRPISRLATEANHQAVEFLISNGSNPKYAVEAYALAGCFVTKQNAEFLLGSFANPDIRQCIADRAKEIAEINIDIDAILARFDNQLKM